MNHIMIPMPPAKLAQPLCVLYCAVVLQTVYSVLCTVLCSHLLAQHALGGDLLAGGGDDLLAVLSDGRVHHLVILLGTEVCRYQDIYNI